MITRSESHTCTVYVILFLWKLAWKLFMLYLFEVLFFLAALVHSFSFFFFLNEPPTPEIYPFPLPAPLPISCHYPQEAPACHVLAGHVHPAVVLRGPGRDALRLPCFAVHAGFTLLPAFGLFTDMASLPPGDRKSTRLNSSHLVISYAVFCLKK